MRKVGSRAIVVDGRRYRWRVRRSPTYSQAAHATALTFSAQREDGGPVLLVGAGGPRPDNWLEQPGVIVTPGWWPARSAVRSRPDGGLAWSAVSSIGEGFGVAWFRCLVRGENFPGQMIGAVGFVGFYVTRFVEAADAVAAETVALQSLRSETQLVPPPGYVPSGQARVVFEEVAELAAEGVPLARPGFAWHSMRAGTEPAAPPNPAPNAGRDR